MSHIFLRNILGAALLCPFAAFAGGITYYDCMNPDGSMSYRVMPCTGAQQEIRRQKELGEAGMNPDVRHELPTDAKQAEPEKQVAAPDGMAAARQDYAAAETASKLGEYADAAPLYRRAAERGYAPAQFGMGVMYDIGRGVAQDYKQALLWYTRAAEQGDMKAQNNLGFMYSQGKGVAQDYVAAHMWFNISGARGYEDGRKNREFLEGLMQPEQVVEAQRRAGEWMKQHP